MLAIIILTHNEERHIARATEMAKKFASEIFVVDSGSVDNTVNLAEAAGATVLHHPFVNQAKQFQWALLNAPITADWVMRLDADEYVEPDLAAEIVAKLPSLSSEICGVNLKRKHIFMGRWIRNGGRYPLVLLRIWRRGTAEIEDRWMDEHMYLTSGRAVTFGGGFADCNLNDLSYFVDKHNKYATREAVDVLNRRYHLLPTNETLSAEGSSRQAAFKRFVKERIYNHLPFWLGPLGYFLYRYFFQLGFLDGRPGLIYHFLQGFWYRFLVGAKICELETALANISERDKIAELSRLTGLKL